MKPGGRRGRFCQWARVFHISRAPAASQLSHFTRAPAPPGFTFPPPNFTFHVPRFHNWALSHRKIPRPLTLPPSPEVEDEDTSGSRAPACAEGSRVSGKDAAAQNTASKQKPFTNPTSAGSCRTSRRSRSAPGRRRGARGSREGRGGAL